MEIHLKLFYKILCYFVRWYATVRRKAPFPLHANWNVANSIRIQKILSTKLVTFIRVLEGHTAETASWEI